MNKIDTCFPSAVWLVCIICIILLMIISCYPQPVPTIPVQSLQNYVYLPIITQSPSKFGVALTHSWEPGACELAAQYGGWHYNWAAYSPCAGSIPMIWSARYIRDLNRIGIGELVMLWNEPERPDQAAMTPTACAVAQRIVETARPDLRLTSPAVLYLDYLKDIREEYMRLFGNPPLWHAIVVHCYAEIWPSHTPEFPALCREHVEQAIDLADAWGIDEVWLTEVSACDGVPIDGMQELLEWLAQEQQVTRVAWFTAEVREDDPWSSMCVSGLDGVWGDVWEDVKR